jgi:hypothetical protein
MKDTNKETAIDELLKKFHDTRIHDAIRAFLSDLLDRLPGGFGQYLVDRDGASQLPQLLRRHFKPADMIEPNGCQRTWELVGLWFTKYENRSFEAAEIFLALYEYLCECQLLLNKWIAKGMPLVWISDCFGALNYVELPKKYLMLTMIEDAIREKGKVSAGPTGSYFRLVWLKGMSDSRFKEYARQSYKYFVDNQEYGIFPEWILQKLGNDWLIEIPSPSEAFTYQINPVYLRFLLSKTGDRTGKALEYVAAYLMSCMPGVKTQINVRSGPSEYDVICSMDGFQTDFRSEFGRYFLCECKDWSTHKADFTVFAKFCRQLDSVKSKFGVLFSQKGITGERKPSAAFLEQIKVFQDRGMVIAVIDQNDIDRVAEGANLVQLLRNKYEKIRLDLR